MKLLVALGLVIATVTFLWMLIPMLTPAPANIACTLDWESGTLAAVADQTGLVGRPGGEPDVLLHWPDGWHVQPGSAGLEVVDATGAVRARTETRVEVFAVSDTGLPKIENGTMLVCPFERVFRDPSFGG